MKRLADQLHASQLAFESSVAHEIWQSHYEDLKLDTGPALVGKDLGAVPLLKQELFNVFGILDADVHPSQKGQIKPGTCIARGDVVLLEGSIVGELWLNFRLVPSGKHWCIVSIYEALGRNLFSGREHPVFARVSDVRSACVFQRVGGRQ